MNSHQPLKLYIPSKTFLLGEYLALKGRGAITFAGYPRFQLQVQTSEMEQASPFHPQSPAGLFWLENQAFFKNYKMQFGMEETAGAFSGSGWGGSTAEFIGLHTLFQLRETLWIEQERFFDLHRMLADYRRLTQNPSALFEASGADLVGQVRGGISYFHKNEGKIQTFSWPFPNLKMLLVSTGKKLKTHEHLAQLQDFDERDLLRALETCHQALKLVEEDQFIAGIRMAALSLAKLGFVAEHTQKLLQQLKETSVAAAKGCGALGADVVACFYTEEHTRQEVETLVHKFGGEVIASHKSIAPGLAVDSPRQQHKEMI